MPTVHEIIWKREFLEKIRSKHHVHPEEVREVLRSNPKVRFLNKGIRSGENVYGAFGKTGAGRYLTVIFIYKRRGKGLILSARDMDDKERRFHAKK